MISGGVDDPISNFPTTSEFFCEAGDFANAFSASAFEVDNGHIISTTVTAVPEPSQPSLPQHPHKDFELITSASHDADTLLNQATSCDSFPEFDSFFDNDFVDHNQDVD